MRRYLLPLNALRDIPQRITSKLLSVGATVRACLRTKEANDAIGSGCTGSAGIKSAELRRLAEARLGA